MNAPPFVEAINSITKLNNYSCSNLFSICNKYLHPFFNVKNDNNSFLLSVYQYIHEMAFPSNINGKLQDKEICLYELYIKLLKHISIVQKNSVDDTFQSKYPLFFLTNEEFNTLENPAEYTLFVKYFNQEHIYEMMKLNQELLGYNTLDHICCVHYLSLSIGRQLKSLNIPIDLGRISGGATGHDIGKYGCKGNELNRVPYLHYYYTDQWFKKRGITYIGHIAVNHSTWDLELENLPLESLILIYCDFRIKNRANSNGTNEMHIFSLDESFNIILSKLDNLNDDKIKRYYKVFSKLKDFENFMLHLGIDIDIPKSKPISNMQEVGTSRLAILHGNDITKHIKYNAINHNIRLMHMLRDTNSLNLLLEIIRSERDWDNLREYIHVLSEYSTYLTPQQKIITMKFLYENLIHPEDVIRRQCSMLIGYLISKFDEKYRKEVPYNENLSSPEITSDVLFIKYLNLFLYPDYKITSKHQSWIRYLLPHMIETVLLNSCNTEFDNYLNIFINFFTNNIGISVDINITLIEACKSIPFKMVKQDLSAISKNALKFSFEKNEVLSISSLELILKLVENDCIKNDNFLNDVKYMLTSNVALSEIPSENFLKYKLAQELNLDKSIISIYSSFIESNAEMIPTIYLSNLKSATPWKIKKIQAEFLLEHSLKAPEKDGLYTAIHFCNLLKVSSAQGVREYVGESLVKIVSYLSPSQINDVAVELIRALEVEEYTFAGYMPEYLGQIMLYLSPQELDEFIDDISIKIKQSNSRISCLLLKTLGIVISNYPLYSNFFAESLDRNTTRLSRLLGILLNGLVNYDLKVRQIALSVIGKYIFASTKLDLKYKKCIFSLIAKKILTLVYDSSDKQLLFLSNSAALNHIYRFISDYTHLIGEIHIDVPGKVAFFPGTFDPFSLSHKEIIKSIRSLGFEVYLQIDEFSWSKQSIPNKLRRNIVNMSVSDELGIYIFPSDIPINLANNNDLITLRSCFPKSKVYIVTGSDVITNASAYRSENLIFSFPHIIFERKTTDNSMNELILSPLLKKLSDETIRLTLPIQFENISSTQIRNCINENRDISNLVDPLAQKYVYDMGLYRQEPRYKSIIKTVSIKIEIISLIHQDIINEILHDFFDNYNEAISSLKNFSDKPYAHILILKNATTNSIIGFSLFHLTSSANLFSEFHNTSVCEFLRINASGRLAIIDGIFIREHTGYENIPQIILTETLCYCIENDYIYAVYKNIIPKYNNGKIIELLFLNGFKLIDHIKNNPVLIVNMSHPCTLNMDLDFVIKEPFRTLKSLRNTIKHTRQKLQRALTSLYPGHLVLPFDIDIMHEHLIKKICKENEVSDIPYNVRKLGPLMCVPYGNILHRFLVPNTVTKPLHTEKLFDPNMKNFKIGPYPYYLDLPVQIKMLRSFNRPVILVDDLLNKGYRIQALNPILKAYNINVHKIIVGILSGRGKELMDIQKRKVDCAYFIPNLRVWFNENNLYPFIGGDSLWRGIYPSKNLISSINLILPYTYPTFIRNSENDSIYNLSVTCIENSIDILTALEYEYQSLHERNLTLELLGEVLTSPRCPDLGNNIHYNLNLSASHYLKNDLEHLKRIKFFK